MRHVAVVAKFLDDNKPIKSLKSLFALFQTSPILFNFIILANLAEISLGPYLSLAKFRKRKRQFHDFCVVFTYSIKWACEIRKFHVVVVQRWQRNVQNSVIHEQSCCLLTYYFFAVLLAVARLRAVSLVSLYVEQNAQDTQMTTHSPH